MNQAVAVDLNRHSWRWRACGLLAGLIFLTGCAATSPHRFAQPSPGWETRSGQLLYRNGQTTLIGDVVVRFSKTGDLDLTFSKGPGLVLLTVREDSSFADVKGVLARNGWSGPIDRAPVQLRGWLGLRDELVRPPHRQVIRYQTGTQSFLFQF